MLEYSRRDRACAGIFPMQNVFVRKVKVLKKPKFDLVKLMELHEGSGDFAATRPRAREELSQAAGRPRAVLGWNETTVTLRRSTYARAVLDFLAGVKGSSECPPVVILLRAAATHGATQEG